MNGLLPPPVWPATAPPADGRLGSATLAPPDAVVAGAFGTWTLTYTAGRFGIDDGGALRVVFHQTSDLGAPQLAGPAAPDYCTAACSAPPPCHLEARYERELGVRPQKRVLVLRVRDEALRPGDTVRVTIGDRSGGSPGAGGQTYAGPLRLQVLVDAYSTGIFLPVCGPLEVPVVAGPPDLLRVHAPSDATANTPFEVVVVALDARDNVVSHRRETATLPAPGIATLPVADAATGLRAESNPLRVHPADAPPALRGYWGDLHAQSEETVGSGALDEYFTHARDCAAVDFVGHQGNDFQVTEPVWRAVMAKTQEYDAGAGFVTFAGYEWSGNTPGGGDHNVHFKGGPDQEYTLHRSGHWQVPDRTDEATDRYPVTDLYATLRGREDVLLIPHVGGRQANLRECFDEALMPLVEIASCWGVFEWFAADAFERGHDLGFSAGSDDHTARPGMSHAPPGHFATGGGLTAVLARDHSRDALWEALKGRRTYATTGARILLDVTARTGGTTYPMGSVIRAPAGQPVEIATNVYGTAPLWRVEVERWPEVIYRHPLTAGKDRDLDLAGPPAPPVAHQAGRHRLRIGWAGSRIRARHRMVTWDGALAVEGGRFLRAGGWGFDQPETGIAAWDQQSVRWRSETASDWDGIVVDVVAGPDAKLRFATGPATFTFRPADLDRLDNGTLVVPAGGLDMRVEIERDAGPDQPRTAEFTLLITLPATPPGAPNCLGDPYFVRVTQQDGHIAWSSPFYVRWS